ncbi:SDR family oxidoreductase [Dyella subtropica]|uniref:SDR family oxidoreductase n=1 Tax=Dyella subtropica TaxID=2992127 RepID=UPI00224DF225|nr:SDR family oxidoreductase [Dyella subtropica]
MQLGIRVILSPEAVAPNIHQPASIETASYVERTYGRRDILVNNAGIMLGAFDKQPSVQSPDHWRATFDTHLLGVVAMMRLARSCR